MLRELEGDRFGSFQAMGPLRRTVIVDRYLDTAERRGRLQQAAMRARLRRQGRSVTLTVKRAGAARTDGISARVELEGPATPSLDPQRWPDSRARTALLEIVGDLPLVEIGRLRQDRLVRVVEGEGAQIEVSLDRVDALVENRLAARRYELEVELKQGDELALARLGGELGRLSGLGPAAGSKLAFAIGARRGRMPTAAQSGNDRLLDSRPR